MEPKSKENHYCSRVIESMMPGVDSPSFSPPPGSTIIIFACQNHHHHSHQFSLRLIIIIISNMSCSLFLSFVPLSSILPFSFLFECSLPPSCVWVEEITESSR